MIADVSRKRAVCIYTVYQCNKVNFVCLSNRNIFSALKLELVMVFECLAALDSRLCLIIMSE